MLNSVSVNRVLYRCHKTVLEMLQDRGYGIADDLIEMEYDSFEQRHLSKDNISILVKRPIPGRFNNSLLDAEGNPQ